MPQPIISIRRRRPRGFPAAALAFLMMFAVSMGASAVRAEAQPAGPTPQQLAGQRVIYSYPGLTPPQSLFDDIRAGRAAGVIFFGENISSREQIAGVVAQLRQAQAESPISVPLLLMTDQEGGLVRRLPGDPVPSAKQIGQSANPVGAALDAGTGAGNNLRGVGMNVNLAPVLDVYDTPGNFIDAPQRSFSDNPYVVAALGSAFLAAQQATGVAATAKHFPGLGKAPAGQNTDLGPVTLPVSLSTLRSVDELPYPAARVAGVKLVMMSWAVYPALDADRPAGLSPTIVDRELRGRNGFRGVTITDALEAGALNSFGTTGERAVAAASAGMDLILCSARDTAQGEDARTALADAYTSGRLDPRAFTEAVDRVTALRAGLA
ncbi:glycoside hydrolase family 3 N-terminal domain-containing protein [Nocardia transvalensis]|uniref:glycoside hydrolase family 3 N-terminal domain-containing protein n=1 Tax=Nocardia transvalensis TaxID=37333 RepID=UPI00189340D5|nr:glycoside hydrolase family 3 N-terminal domain-containing protein [Nocardia transvalensis]MBF6327708.1 beta-N-acetylhexosaminidase [Nocardia transvalensis]